MRTMDGISTVAASLLFGVFAAGTASAAEQFSQATAEKYIKASEAAWAETVATNDASVLKRIMADDCVWVLDGELWDKARAVADAAKGPGDFLSDHLDYAHVRFFGNTAVVQGSETWTRTRARKGRFVWTDTWVLRNGQWQIVQAEDITVPETK
jgi:ketosteroid isomerase-like protein